MSVRRSSYAAPDYRTEFSTREGVYRNIHISEHCRPSRQPLFGKELSPVKVSFVTCKDKNGVSEWIVFNAGKELYVYPFGGVGKVCCKRYSGVCGPFGLDAGTVMVAHVSLSQLKHHFDFSFIMKFNMDFTHNLTITIFSFYCV